MTPLVCFAISAALLLAWLRYRVVVNARRRQGLPPPPINWGAIEAIAAATSALVGIVSLTADHPAPRASAQTVVRTGVGMVASGKLGWVDIDPSDRVVSGSKYDDERPPASVDVVVYMPPNGGLVNAYPANGAALARSDNDNPSYDECARARYQNFTVAASPTKRKSARPQGVVPPNAFMEGPSDIALCVLSKQRGIGAIRLYIGHNEVRIGVDIFSPVQSGASP
jgi:hypothetical protein